MSLPTLSGRPRLVTGAQAVIKVGDCVIEPFTLPYCPGPVEVLCETFTFTVRTTKRQRKQMRRFMCALFAKTSRRSRKAKRWTR